MTDTTAPLTPKRRASRLQSRRATRPRGSRSVCAHLGQRRNFLGWDGLVRCASPTSICTSTSEIADEINPNSTTPPFPCPSCVPPASPLRRHTRSSGCKYSHARPTSLTYSSAPSATLIKQNRPDTTSSPLYPSNSRSLGHRPESTLFQRPARNLGDHRRQPARPASYSGFTRPTAGKPGS